MVKVLIVIGKKPYSVVKGHVFCGMYTLLAKINQQIKSFKSVLIIYIFLLSLAEMIKLESSLLLE